MVGEPSVRILQDGPRLPDPTHPGLCQYGSEPPGGENGQHPAVPQHLGHGPDCRRRVVEFFEQVVAEHEIGGVRPDRLRQPVGVALDALDPLPTRASVARRRRMANASIDESTTTTRQPRTASGTALVPLPPPTSTTTGCSTPAIAASARSSGSGTAPAESRGAELGGWVPPMASPTADPPPICPVLSPPGPSTIEPNARS